MDLVRTAEQQELGDAVRALLDRHATSAATRAAIDTDAGHDPELWRRLGEDIGVLGLTVPEALGGAGAGHVERAVVAEELGRALTPSPFLGSSVLAVDVLTALGDTDLLPALATGEKIAAVAVAEGGGVLDPGSGTRARRDGDGWVIDGRKTPVLAGDVADVLLVHATTDDGPAFFRVDATAPGLSRTTLVGLDPTRRLARIDLAGVPAGRLDGDADAALRHAADLAAVVLAAEQVGLMSAAVERTVAYVTDRVQFGRPIGSYQAVKHGCADMYAATEQAVSAARAAAWAADHDPDGLPSAAAVAQVYVGPACFAVAGAMVQYHGGIGYTWEHDAHLFYKRAKSDELLLGPPRSHRARLAELLAI